MTSRVSPAGELGEGIPDKGNRGSQDGETEKSSEQLEVARIQAQKEIGTKVIAL